MTRTPIQHVHAKALTRLLLTIRPDWSTSYTEDAIAKMRDISDDLEDIVRVAVRGALSPAVRKPDALAMHGDHWKARADAGEPDAALRPPKPVWHDCGSYHRPDQPCPERMPERVRADATPHLAAMRALMAERRTAIPTAVKDKLDEAAETAKRHAKEDADA